MAECLGRTALLPGRDYLHQLRLILAAVGTPTEEQLAFVENKQAVDYIQSLPARAAPPFAARFPSASPLAVDLLVRLLVFEPRGRLSAVAALEHAYLAELHDVNDEPTAPRFEEQHVAEADLRGLIWDELRRVHPEVSPAPPAAFMHRCTGREKTLSL
jgi:serine/threonine protein kinase